MEKMKRTHHCGELTRQNMDSTVILNGWVHKNRNHGGIIFIDLRDRYGITQIVIDSDANETLTKTASELKFEFCIAVEGLVRSRPENMVNKNMVTGEIEVKALNILILSQCETLPFMIEETTEAREDLRFKYRFLDLRSFNMQKNIKLRHDVAFAARKYLIQSGFYEIETPTLIRSTPEGARDFVVPSRLQPGKFYALPQSPQLYKQILMVSGFDKYFQIARCFRDEDARGDRQLEHTQIDIEMSFVSKEDIFKTVEGLMQHLFKSALNMDIKIPFTRLPYDQAMELYGTDKPDLRFGLQLKLFNQFVPGGDFQVFKSVLENDGTIKALIAPGCSEFSRKKITELEEKAKVFGAKGLAWMKVVDNDLQGGISKFYTSTNNEIIEYLEAKSGDLILLVGSTKKIVNSSLNAIRNFLGKELNLIDNNQYQFCWITSFPLFEWNEDENKWDPAHHMFSMPEEKYINNMEDDPGKVKGDLYDLVCNGVEIASGSIRIHSPELQKRIFNIVGFPEEEAMKRFGFLLNAFKYGPPPHGGIAPGLDRLVMLMAKQNTIREVIAFPKNTLGISPMDDAPSEIDSKQLDELSIQIKLNKE